MAVCVARGCTMGLTLQDRRDEESSTDSCAAMDSPQITDRSAELEKKLRARADREHLVQKNILPDFSSSPVLFQQTKELQKKKNADCLQKKLRNRPERQNLMQMNILPVDVVDPGLVSKQMMLRKNKLADELNRKIASRPGPLELIKGRILAPDNHELSEVVPDVMRMFEQEKTSPSELVYGASLTSPQAEYSPPSKESVTSPLSDISLQPQSPEEMVSPVGRIGFKSPPFNLPQLIPPSPMQIQPHTAAQHAVGIMAASRKSLSPSQARKKQQKQKYRKLRYHEYIPPTKNNGKGGKTNPKPAPKQETPYDHILQQQQLFLQLQVLQQQYPNGVLMQKLPDIVDSLSKSGKGGKGKATSPSGVGGAAGGVATVAASVPQVVMVEHPNQFQVTSIRFEELKVSDLKAACKEMGMIVSGKKAELVERLIEHNHGYLPVIALPETQVRDPQRALHGRHPHAAMLDPQVPISGLSPPSPTSLSPVFKFPGDQGGGNHGLSEGNIIGVAAGRKGSVSSISSMGAPQLIPALSLQQQFDELVERQKRSYICQGQAQKSLAPRPELGDMVAIKFPCPVDPRGRGAEPHQPQQRSGKGTTLPRQGSGGNSATTDSKIAVSPFVKQSHSLPSSPQPLSPSNGATQLLGEVMDETTSEQPRSLQVHSSTGAAMLGKLHGDKVTHAPPPRPNSQHFITSTLPCSSGAATSNGLAFSGIYSQTNQHAPLMATSSYYSQHSTSSSKPPLRQTQSISAVPIRGGGVAILPPKMHPAPPPPYGSGGSGLMQRSMSLTNPYQHGLHHHPRVHSGASFSSDTGELIGTQEGLFFQEEVPPHPADVPMDTHESVPPHDLSEIFSILEGDPAGFAVPGQPPSYSAKLSSSSHRQDSLRSDSVMLGGALSYQSPNPPLSLVHKSNSDLCLMESAGGHKHPMNPPPYGGAGAMLGGGGVSWLDHSESGGAMMSDVSPSVGSLGLNTSNPGSLTHEGFQMNFLDDMHLHGNKMSAPSGSGNPNMNGFSQGDYLTHSLPTSISLPFQQDESQTLIELGLSSS